MAHYGSMMQQSWMDGHHPVNQPNGTANGVQDPKRLQHPVIHVVGDVKPRLTKEQHDILESHFRQQHKPSTQTKKGFAENLGVPLDKINNWFQNRRAKVKQDAKKAINAQTMFAQQMMAQQMQNANMAAQHSEFFPGQPHLGPSAFPMDSANPNFALQGGQPIMGNMNPMVGQQSMDISAIAAKPNFMAFEQPQDFAFEQYTMTNVQDFGAMYDMPGMDTMDFPFVAGAPMQATQSNGSTPSIPSTLSSMPSHSTMPSSIGGHHFQSTMSTEWNGDSKPSIYFSEASDSTVAAQGAYCSPPEDSSTARWVSQQPAFEEASSPEDMERPGSAQNLPPTPPDNKSAGELELPQAAFSRRPSSTGLSEPLGAVDLETRSSSVDDGFKQPGEPSSIAARRQRPRPAAIGQAALRSASYSAGTPISPGSNPNNLSAPDQQLRRIRSSGVPGAQSGRVQKQTATGQRSPLHMSFADAADSPKFARHAATWAAPIPSPGAQSLAPPTPLTPHEGGRFPSWQSYGSVNSHHNSVDHSSPNGVAYSWTNESPAQFPVHSVSSPPDTPLDPAQVAQYNEWLRAADIHRDTPPQSAPAFQQSFHPATFNYTVAHENGLAVNPSHLGHIRKSSLPEHSKMMAPQAPMFHAPTSDMPLSYQAMPFDHMQMQHVAMQPPATLPSQTTQAFPTPPQPAPAAIPAHNTMLPADFAVHEYLPPGIPRAKNSSSPAASAEASGPKMFHFSNTGPKDFAA